MESSRPAASFTFDTPPHILIIEARFYSDIADLQLAGVKAVLDRAKATHEIISVPGALEISAAVAFAVKAGARADGFIALGCVIKGGTMHDEIVGMESARGLQDLANRHALAIGNGILTCNDREQALERADATKLNRSGEAAEAALRMIELKQYFRIPPQRRLADKS